MTPLLTRGGQLKQSQNAAMDRQYLPHSYSKHVALRISSTPFHYVATLRDHGHRTARSLASWPSTAWVGRLSLSRRTVNGVLGLSSLKTVCCSCRRLLVNLECSCVELPSAQQGQVRRSAFRRAGIEAASTRMTFQFGSKRRRSTQKVSDLRVTRNEAN